VKGDIRVTPTLEAGAPEPEHSAAAAPEQADGPAVPAPAPIRAAAIAAEIRALRRGRGLRGDVAERIGPLLRELAAGPRPAPGAWVPGDEADVRGRLAARLGALAQDLPEDLRTAILAALAVHEATRNMRTYDQRKEWAARQLDRGARTAERRIDEAQDLLAQQVAAELARQRGRPPVVAEADKWYVERFSAVFLLDGEAPEAIEQRVIRSNVDDLAELTIALDVPVDSGQPRLPLQLDVLSGGELEIVEEKARTRTQYVIRLPRPLRAGEAHEYVTKIQVLPGGQMRDFYVFRPERRCERFDLKVRFDRRRMPAWVRRVAGEDVYSYNSYDGVPADDERVSVDRTGEATQSFSELLPHYGFGLQWGWSG